jgi:hypothetical protein
MHLHDWLDSRDRHNAVDVWHVLRPRDVLVTYFVDVAIPRSSDVAVTGAGDIAIAIDAAELRHCSEAVGRACAGDRLLAGVSDTLCLSWERDRDDCRAQQSQNTPEVYGWF